MRLLVIGGGSIGERHTRCFSQLGRAEVALCEIRDDVRQRVAAEYKLAASFADLSEAIRWSPEAAVICTPAHLHVPQALELAQAGCHLLIEKPLSTSEAGLEELLQVVREGNLTAGIAYVYRAHPALAQMREAIQQGRFGRPVQLVMVGGQHFPLYRPAYREIYYRDRASGGGAIQDALTHMLNAGEWLIGPIDEVTADAAHQVLEGVEVEDTVHVLARQGSVLASYALNQHQAPNESTLTVICQRGTARFESHRHRWLAATEPGAEWEEQAAFALERDDLFVRQAAAFLDAVEQRTPTACSLEEGRQTLRVNLAILASADAQRAGWQRIEPTTPSPQPTVQQLFDLTGKTALISGASGHLGSALARALAEAGATVVCTSRDQARASEAAASLPTPCGAKHLGVQLDHMDEGSLTDGFHAAIQQAGQLDVLVNNGHAGDGHDWTNVTAEQFDQQLRNATGYFLLSRLFREHAVSRGAQGSIILLGSMYGIVGSYPDAYEGVCAASPVHYHALKGGIVHMTRHLAAYWAADGVRVNCLSPGPFPSQKAPAEMVQRLCGKSPMGRMGQPHELKGALLLLASAAGSYITGQNLVVDGGWTAW